MKQEPIAWMHPKDKSIIAYEPEPDLIPLYTAPKEYQRPNNTVLVPCDKLKEMQDRIKELESAPKQLSDEEIMKIHSEVLERPHFQQVHLDPLKFARAILKKAREK